MRILCTSASNNAPTDGRDPSDYEYVADIRFSDQEVAKLLPLLFNFLDDNGMTKNISWSGTGFDVRCHCDSIQMFDGLGLLELSDPVELSQREKALLPLATWWLENMAPSDELLHDFMSRED